MTERKRHNKEMAPKKEGKRLVERRRYKELELQRDLLTQAHLRGSYKTKYEVIISYRERERQREIFLEEELLNCTHVLKALIWNSNSGFGCFRFVCEHKKNLKKKKKMKMGYGVCEILILGF